MKTIIMVFGIMLFISCNTTKKVNSSLKDSKVVHISIDSKSLGENRKLDVYLPKGYKKGVHYSIVYCADGQIVVNAYKAGIDSLIEHGIIPPILVVGEYSNEKKTQNRNLEYRNYEYVNREEDVSTDESELKGRFANHYDFFTKEMIGFVEDRYGLTNNRIFYGTSNGAGFGVSISAKEPALFKKYICMSMAAGDYEANNWSNQQAPYFYLAYGVAEPFPLVLETTGFDEFLTKEKIHHKLTTYEGGHQRQYWQVEFMKALPEILKE